MNDLKSHMRTSFEAQDKHRPKSTKRFFGGSPNTHMYGDAPGYVDIPVVVAKKDPMNNPYQAVDYYRKNGKIHYVNWNSGEDGSFDLDLEFEILLSLAKEIQVETSDSPRKKRKSIEAKLNFRGRAKPRIKVDPELDL